MVTPSSLERRRGLRLRDACDELEALLTCPGEPTAQRACLDRGSPQPAVDLGAWRTHIAFRHHRRRDDRAQLVEHYAEGARRLARRFYRHGEPLDDLEQVAIEGLLLAIERFEPRRGLPFMGFARPTIVGSLKRFYRDCGWAVRVPRRVHELSRPLRDAHDQLSQDLRRAPTAAELSDALRIPVHEVRAAQVAERRRMTTPLDHFGASEDGLEARLGSVDPRLARVEEREAVQRAVNQLTDDTRELLGLYFEDGLTQTEIAGRLGVSQMHVSRLIGRALSQLRTHLPDD